MSRCDAERCRALFARGRASRDSTIRSVKNISATHVAAVALALTLAACKGESSSPGVDTPVTSGPCAFRDANLTLPAGFCASVFADNIGPARHVAVASNGDVFVTLQDGNAAFVSLRDAN